MRLAELAGSGREPAYPAQVELPDAANLHIDLWLRILPGLARG